LVDLKVCRSLLSLASTCLARKKQPFKVGARKIAEAVSKALADSVEKLRAKQEACATQATGKTSVLDENEYMKIIRDIVKLYFWLSNSRSTIRLKRN